MPKPMAPVTEQARRVLRTVRNPIWNMFTAPETKAFRMQMTGTIMPVRIHPITV